MAAELARQVDAALAAGVDAGQHRARPGPRASPRPPSTTGALLARLDELTALGFPVLVGASRKAFLGRLLAGPDGAPAPVDAREHATVATSVLAAVMGAWGVRVHEVDPDPATRSRSSARLEVGRPWLTGSR